MSETTKLKLFKYDNPSTNEELFDIEKALNENWDKIDVATGSIIEENEKIISQIPTGQASGDFIQLTDSSNLNAKLNIKGNYMQDGTPTFNTPIEVKTVRDVIKSNIINKNLFDKNNYTLFSGNVSKDSGLVNTEDTRHKWVVIPINVENILISSFAKKIEDMCGRLVCLSKLPEAGDTFLSAAMYPNYNTIVTPIGTKYVMLYLGGTYMEGWTSISDLINYVMISVNEKSLTEDDYLNYDGQNFELLVQQEMLTGDYFDLNNLKEVHTWKKIILTGNENFKVYESGQTGDYETYQLNIVNNPITSWTENNGLVSNYFDFVGHKVYSKSQIGIACGNGAFIFICTDILNLDEFKTKLKELYEAGTPVIIYLKMKVITELDLTEEQKNILEKLQKINTYKNITNIFSSNDVSPIFEIEYKKDLETINKNQEEKIATLEAALLS